MDPLSVLRAIVWTFGLLVLAFAVYCVLGFYAFAHDLFGPCDPYCNSSQWKPVGNNSGVVAIVRREYSGGMPGDYDAVPNTVYVHRWSESNANENLALRYYALEEPGSLPIVRWTGRTSLTVIVAAKSIVQVTRERPGVGGTVITYRLPRAVCRATNSSVERTPIPASCDYRKELRRFGDAIDSGFAYPTT